MSGDASTSTSISEMLGSEIMVKGPDGKPTLSSLSALDGKYVGIYFSAHWCPPCRAFTPKLRKTYEALTKAGKPFEIVFASSDHNEQQFAEYYGEMPWAALPFNSPRKAALSRQFSVSSIPSLVILSPDGRVLSRNARGAVLRNPEGFPWEGDEDPSGSGTNYNMIIWGVLLVWFLFKIFVSK